MFRRNSCNNLCIYHFIGFEHLYKSRESISRRRFSFTEFSVSIRKHAVYLYAGTDIRETSTKSVNENASSSIKRLVEARDVTWRSKNIVRDP